MKKTISIVACAVFALSTMVGVAQGDNKAAVKKEEPKKEMAPAKESKKEATAKKEAPKAEKKEAPKAETPKTDKK